jgi:hypothetical protein
MSSFSFHCQQCGTNARVQLPDAPDALSRTATKSMVFFQCAHCRLDYVRIEGQNFPLTAEAKAQFDEIRKIAEAGGDVSIKVSVRPVVLASPSVPPELEDAPPLTRRDLDNIKIDLETTQTVEEFIARM